MKTLPDRLVVAGTSISVITAVVAALVTKPGEAVVLGIAIGLGGTVLSVQLSIVSKIDQSSQLDGLVAAVPWLRQIVLAIAEASVSIEQEARLEPFREAAQKELQQCSATLHGIARGQLRARVGEGILSRKTEETRNEILAVSIQDMDVPRWVSDLGRKYWRANIAALARGVKIERVFVYREWTEELARIVDEQVERGVLAYKVERSVVVPDELIIDMAVWDRAFTYQFELNSEGIPINNLYSVNEADVARRIEQFEILKSLAKELTPAPLIPQVGRVRRIWRRLRRQARRPHGR